MNNKKQNDNPGQAFAIVLIVTGIIWILSKIGISLQLHHIIPDIMFSIRSMINSLPSFLFSWPMILLVVGLILLAGKRSSGLVLIIAGSILLLPKIFFLPGLTVSLLIPAILVGVGVAMVLKHAN